MLAIGNAPITSSHPVETGHPAPGGVPMVFIKQLGVVGHEVLVRGVLVR